MPHVLWIYDEEGNLIGEYYPPHDGEGGRVAARVVINEEAFAKAVAKSLGKKDVTEITVTFKGK